MRASSSILWAALALAGPLAAAPAAMPNPDFTKGEPMPAEAARDYTLGAIGARGWIHSHKLATLEARQVYITTVADGSPADGALKVGDVLLGVAGKPFSHDPREEIGRALTNAEAEDGKLAVTRWRDGETEEVALSLQVLGSYSPTAPYDCPKSRIIVERGCEALAERMEEPEYTKQNAISRSLNALGLLAGGDAAYHRILKREAEWAAAFSEKGFQAWWYGYVTVFLAEYVLATGDTSVLPGLRRLALEASEGQSMVGSWGHRFAGPDGRLYGYGMMHSPGEVLTIGLVLAREAGVKDPEVDMAIKRSVSLLRFYIGKGSIPYGDHAPYMAGHEDNGKCGMAAVLFDLLGDREGTGFFAKMSAASHGSERDEGHTGNFFNLTWAMPGVSRAGSHATGAWMEEFGSWYFDLTREWDWSFPFPGAPKERLMAYNGWDMTGAFLIAYAMPEKAIRLTGSEPSVMPPLGEGEARQVVIDGRGFSTTDPTGAYDQLPPDILLELLANWSPIVRERAAISFAKHRDLSVAPILRLLDSPAIHSRLGGCQAITWLGSRAEVAVPRLRELLKADDLWLRVKAAEALAAIGTPAMAAVPELLEMAAKGPSAADPRAMEQRFITQALFNSRNGMLGKSLEGVDRARLLEAVKAGLSNQDGRTRGSLASVYSNLTIGELKPILPAIHRAIVEKSPSGIMFDGQIQNAGLDLFSRHHVSEGIELIADYVRVQKKHGSDGNLPRLLEMLKRYGAHAQRAIPELEKAARYFENEEEDFPKQISLRKAEMVRKAIAEIRTLTGEPELVELDL